MTERLPFVLGLALPVWLQQPLNVALDLAHSLCNLQCQLPSLLLPDMETVKELMQTPTGDSRS